MNPYQTAPERAVLSGSFLFALLATDDQTNNCRKKGGKRAKMLQHLYMTVHVVVDRLLNMDTFTIYMQGSPIMHVKFEVVYSIVLKD